MLVPVVWRRESEEAVDLACRLAAERGASIVALTVLEVPLELPLDAELPGEAERKAHDLLDEARAIGDAYGVDVDRPARARAARRPRDRRGGRAAQQRDHRDGRAAARRARRRGRIFGGTVDFVLKNAPCRVMVAAAPRAA